MTTNNSVQSDVTPAECTPAGELSYQQKLALLQRMLGGGSVPAAAKAAGVSRRTAYRWMEEDHPFRRAVRDARLAKCGSARMEIMCAIPMALLALQLEVDCDEVPICMAVTRATNRLHRLEQEKQ